MLGYSPLDSYAYSKVEQNLLDFQCQIPLLLAYGVSANHASRSSVQSGGPPCRAYAEVPDEIAPARAHPQERADQKVDAHRWVARLHLRDA